MVEFKNFNEIAEYFNVKDYFVHQKYENEGWRGSFFINNNEIKINFFEDTLRYIYVDESNNEDCKRYLLKYEVDKYDWKVYADDIEGWQKCKVINLENNGLDIVRAVVETEHGTRLNRLCEYALDESELEANRCIYMIEKSEKQYEENEFYTTKDKILLANNNRGGYFLDSSTNKVENIVYKDSGYANCIMGDLDYFKRLVNNGKVDYEYTVEGKKILGIGTEQKKSLDDLIKEAGIIKEKKEDINQKSKEERHHR